MKNYDYAKIAYEAYRKFSGGISLATGHTIPEFEKLSETIQDAWWEAAQAVKEAIGCK